MNKIADSLIDKIVPELISANDYALSYIATFKFDSPIEERMSVALYTVFLDQIMIIGTIELFNGREHPAKPLITRQAKVGKYRADFLIDAHKLVVVECDGHDFHERTKDQAAHDRSRDRWLTENGYIVLRFTGSEIWKDSISCAQQVKRIAFDFSNT